MTVARSQRWWIRHTPLWAGDMNNRILIFGRSINGHPTASCRFRAPDPHSGRSTCGFATHLTLRRHPNFGGGSTHDNFLSCFAVFVDDSSSHGHRRILRIPSTACFDEDDSSMTTAKKTAMITAAPTTGMLVASRGKAGGGRCISTTLAATSAPKPDSVSKPVVAGRDNSALMPWWRWPVLMVMVACWPWRWRSLREHPDEQGCSRPEPDGNPAHRRSRRPGRPSRRPHHHPGATPR
jgi:hypothetical protein